MSGPVYDDQGSLFGMPDVVGWQSAAFTVRVIPRDRANDLVIRHHYSGKFYNASTMHFGVFDVGGACVGVLQYGYAMNPASQGGVVSDTGMDEYLELNRMWIDDRCERNTESHVISLSLRAIRAMRPQVGWVQSFADERCGRLGVVYQAAGFVYCGEHEQVFWEIDGTLYHNSLMTRDRTLGPSAAFVQDNRERAVRHTWRQFRYIKFLRRSFRKRLLHPVLPYPKPREAGIKGVSAPPTSGEGVGQFHGFALPRRGVA